MPVIDFSYRDFCKLVGKKFSLKDLEDTMPMMGMEWEGVNGDEVSVEVFPNHPDLLSVEGLARAYRAFRGVKDGLAEYVIHESNYELFVDDSVSSVRPFIGAAVVKGVKLSVDAVKSLMQLQEKLHITHCRNRLKAAIGVHDLRAVKFPVKYAAVEPDGIRFIPLDSTKEMTPSQVLVEHVKGIKFAHLVNKFTAYPVVLSADNDVLSFPPIINSELTKVRPSTVDLFIDVTGIDERIVLEALNIIVSSLLERGAKAYSVTIHSGKSKHVLPDFTPVTMNLSGDYCRKLLGEPIPTRSMPVLLRKMGFDAIRDGEDLCVSIPCYRTDIMHPMDLVEDIAISFGYMNFNPTLPTARGVGKEDLLNSRLDYVRDVLSGFGFIEVYNWLLTNQSVLFSKLDVKVHPVVEILQPKSEDLTICRDELAPQVIEFLAKNKHNDYPQSVFEVGDVLILDKEVLQEKHLCVANAHSHSNYSELKAVIDVLFAELGVDVSVRDSSKDYCIPGRVAEFVFNNSVVGFIGELHPKILANHDLKVPVTVCELDIKKLVD
ncbi:MAG TPA: phenylalanine--tRNA ligase subunit beta [Candidatus Nanoarchaeia archaeon]|nr:phenylalanine--tRNA ligase subunit beta [Candidatus Nanoarchaeia archaeon]